MLSRSDRSNVFHDFPFSVLAYYLVKFYLYVFTDGEVHRHKAFQSLVDENATNSWNQYRIAVRAIQRVALKELGGWGHALFVARFGVDYLLPAVVGSYAIVLADNAL